MHEMYVLATRNCSIVIAQTVTVRPIVMHEDSRDPYQSPADHTAHAEKHS